MAAKVTICSATSQRILQVVSLGDGGFVLVPVGELRDRPPPTSAPPASIRGERHRGHGTPYSSADQQSSRGRSRAKRIGEERRPRRGRIARQPPDRFALNGRGVEPALVALPLEHPRPILRLRFDRHVRERIRPATQVVPGFPRRRVCRRPGHSSCSASSRNSSGTDACFDNTTPA